MTRQLTPAATFMREILAIQADQVGRITKKLNVLLQDPTPDEKSRKKIRGTDQPLYRMRCGDYRVFYTFDDATVTVLSARMKGDDTYEDLPEVPVGGSSTGADPTSQQPWQRWTSAAFDDTTTKTLPYRINSQLLDRLQIPSLYHERLSALETEEQLLECEDVPPGELSKVIDVMVGKPIEDILGEPRHRVPDADDLLRWREGELLGFLLQLNPEQERYVSWATNAKGPTLLKGGPGTGKSTVALYRARTMIDALRESGIERPRVLFTTYTNALVKVSQTLLTQLLEDEADLVEVETADKWTMRLATAGNPSSRLSPINERDLATRVRAALESTSLGGDPLEVATNRRLVDRLTPGWFAEEIQTVIEARGLAAEDEYLAASRAGRGVGLNGTQRRFVWRLREAVKSALDAEGVVTWEEVRRRAARATEATDFGAPYDAVLVDEVQDLQPLALRMLVGLCKAPNRLFLTADANQSIYGSGFRWKDVHESLRFTGRTGRLQRNHRSTFEIGEATRDWLRDGALDDEATVPSYVHHGPLPAVRAVEDPRDCGPLLARFFRGASRDLKLALGAAAVLCPSNDDAKRIEGLLRDEGVKATAMIGRELDLSAPGVKLLTLQSAKGLEFPIVALAGFPGGEWPSLPDDDEAADEVLLRMRRTVFVGMTRAMRALLVVTPEHTSSPILDGWNRELWNLGEES